MSGGTEIKEAADRACQWYHDKLSSQIEVLELMMSIAPRFNVDDDTLAQAQTLIDRLKKAKECFE